MNIENEDINLNSQNINLNSQNSYLNILSELNFDDNSVLIHLLNDTNKFKNFNTLTNLHKILIKLNKLYSANINSNTHTTEYFIVFKLFLSFEIFRINYFTKNYIKDEISKSDTKNNIKDNIKSNSSQDFELNNLNEFIYKIYKLFLNKDIGEINQKILDNFINLFLSEYLDNNFTFEKFIDLIENNNSNLRISTNKLIFENFLKFFKSLIIFYLHKNKFKEVYEILDIENKNKILSADLIVCFNKLIRNVEENNIIYLGLKKFVQIIDGTQIYISKKEYYLNLFKCFI